TANFGWQIIVSPKGDRLIVNVPVTEGMTYQQHVMNTVTGAWCRYTGVPARCWGTLNDELYIGLGGGKVARFDAGYSDNGAAVAGVTWQAWNRFRYAGIKRVASFRPIMNCDGALNLTFGFAFDFAREAAEISIVAGVDGAAWDAEDWDAPFWGDAAPIR